MKAEIYAGMLNITAETETEALAINQLFNNFDHERITRDQIINKISIDTTSSITPATPVNPTALLVNRVPLPTATPSTPVAQPEVERRLIELGVVVRDKLLKNEYRISELQRDRAKLFMVMVTTDTQRADHTFQGTITRFSEQYTYSDGTSIL